MSDLALSERQIVILGVVLAGGDSDARWIDITVHVRYGPGEVSVFRDLQQLQALDLVKRDNNRGGVGGRWMVTDAGLAHVA